MYNCTTGERSGAKMQKVTSKAFPLSVQQTRLWSLWQESQIYRAQCLLLLEGDLDRELFEHTIQYVLSRHDILRTLFYPLPGMELPMQIVSSQANFSCTVIHLEHEDKQQQDQHIAEFWSTSLTKP